MSSEALKIWQNLELIVAVNQAMTVFCDVFELSRKQSSVYEFEQVLARIRKGEFSSEERRRGTPPTSREIEEYRRPKLAIPKADDFHHDVFETCQLPCSWDRLADALRCDFGQEVQERVHEALASLPKQNGAEPCAVVRQVLHWLYWQILLRGPGLARTIKESGSFYPWLDSSANRAVDRFSLPSLIFQNYVILRAVGDAWEKFRREKLGLLQEARGYDREDIHHKRRERALQLLGRSHDEDVTEAEIRQLVPWPEPVQEFMKALMDPEQTRDLHVIAHFYADRALRARTSECPNIRFPEIEDVVNEFLDMKVWQAIKNADRWARERRPGATSWAFRLFDKELLKTAFQAINHVMGLPANDPSGPRQWTFDDLHNPDNMADKKSQTPVESLEPDPLPEPSRTRMNRQRQWLIKAFKRMPEDLRVVMQLYLGYSNGNGKKKPLTLEAIAQQLEISPEEAEQRLQSGTAWLKNQAPQDIP